MSERPIRVYRPNKLSPWVIDFGDGREQDKPSREEAVEAANAAAAREGRTVEVADGQAEEEPGQH